MTLWLCRTCAVEYPDTDEPPAACPICSDDRQYVRPSGREWTTPAELASGRAGSVAEIEPRLHGMTVQPSVGTGQRALLVQTAADNLLWDPTGYLDEGLKPPSNNFGGQVLADAQAWVRPRCPTTAPTATAVTSTGGSASCSSPSDPVGFWRILHL